MRVDLHPVFILHTRSYRETSLILEVFSRDYGRIGIVAKGARGKKNRYQNLLQAFHPLQISWAGRGELVTLTGVESEGSLLHLPGEQLASGFYLNEILMRLLHRHEPHQPLFMDYADTLHALHQQRPVEPVLRLFELRLMTHLGYGLLLTEDTHGTPIQAGAAYHYFADHGPVLVASSDETPGPLISGNTLLAMANERLDDAKVLHEAKRLMRYILSSHLGNRPLHSRELFTTWRGK